MESPIINLYGQSLDEKGLILPSSKYREVDVEEPERLAEALCHSQTRARNAEKQATDALTDKARLVKLLDREAISCHAYKERVRLLEVENSWLKACPNHKKVELPGIQNASKMGPHCKFYKQGMSNKSTLEPITVGLAFALGLSCASVGFMVGCCMGLIGFSK
ncbi:hypothetical protein KP509_19G058000 [Ceratopteris richardii]|nr:hypothetical protein KP509_19G058000 [Ceratopteris richardii]